MEKIISTERICGNLFVKVCARPVAMVSGSGKFAEIYAKPAPIARPAIVRLLRSLGYIGEIPKNLKKNYIWESWNNTLSPVNY